MIEIENINNSHIAYELVNDPYYNYCLNLLKNKLNNSNYKINLVLYYFHFNKYEFNNENKTIEICIQYEHTLVKGGGRGINSSTIPGNIKTDSGENYLVRIDRYDYLKNLNYIIEYSLPNIINISKSNNFKDYLKKNLYISPLFELDLNKSDKKNSTITLFYNFSERRVNFYELIDEKKIKCENKTGFYSEKDLMYLYESTKILINIHQTDDHHTFEELRVLPALCRGVIVISENVPLKENIPYYEHILWCNYDEITEKIIEVQNNYEFYFNKIFDEKLKQILNKMKFNNETIINKIEL